MSSFHLEILATDRVFYQGECESLVIPASDGQYGIMAGHCNMVTAMDAGELSFRVPGQEDQVAAVSGGMVKINKEMVLVLADSIERPEEIDANRAREEAEAAMEAMLQQNSRMEYNVAKAQLARAMNRLKLGGRKDVD